MILGIDTSNYTTSAAVLDGEALTQQKQLLEVRPGERGLRQSDALFQHTRNLPLLFDKLPPMDGVTAVGVSTRPRNVEGSYMPCFLAGISAATAAAKAAGCPLYTTSHQVGHILAALYGAGALEMIRAPFVAFHVSGGTTEALLVEPHKEELISARCVAASSDLKAGQLIDRTGVRLGLQFPCGPALEQLALQSRVSYKIKPSMQGANCSLSGVENQVDKRLQAGDAPADIARFVLSSVSAALQGMVQAVFSEYGQLPLLFAGGVMSNTILRRELETAFGGVFAPPALSCDNAAGVAVYAALCSKELK